MTASTSFSPTDLAMVAVGLTNLATWRSSTRGAASPPWMRDVALHLTREAIPSLLPVDLFVPGCPPHPFTILDGLLRLLGRIEEGARVEEGARPPS